MLHSYTSSGLQISVVLGTSTVHYPTTQRLHFAVIDHSGAPAAAHKIGDAGTLQHAQAVLIVDMHEHISGKQREFQFLAPILPPANTAIERQEAVNLFLSKLPAHAFLVTRTGIDCMPTQQAR